MMKLKKVKQEKIDKFLDQLNSGMYKGMKVDVIYDKHDAKVYFVGWEWIVIYFKPMKSIYEYKFYKGFIPK